MPKVKILNLIFKRRYKGVNITFRKWVKEKREEILLNDNAAKSFGYKNKEDDFRGHRIYPFVNRNNIQQYFGNARYTIPRTSPIGSNQPKHVQFVPNKGRHLRTKKDCKRQMVIPVNNREKTGV